MLNRITHSGIHQCANENNRLLKKTSGWNSVENNFSSVPTSRKAVPFKLHKGSKSNMRFEKEGRWNDSVKGKTLWLHMRCSSLPPSLPPSTSPMFIAFFYAIRIDLFSATLQQKKAISRVWCDQCDVMQCSTTDPNALFYNGQHFSWL